MSQGNFAPESKWTLGNNGEGKESSFCHKMRSPMSVELHWQAVPLHMPTGARDEAAHESNKDAVDGDVVE